MKYPRVTIDVAIPGNEDGHYVFECPQTCIIGRAEDCDIRIAEDGLRREISRHHCLLEVDPPVVRIFDLYSTNGTFVNGRRLFPNPDASDLDHSAGTELKDGDEVRLGNTTLHFWIIANSDELEPSAAALLF